MPWFRTMNNWFHLRSLPKRAEAGDNLIYRDDDDAVLSSSWRQFFTSFAVHVAELAIVVAVVVAIVVVLLLLS